MPPRKIFDQLALLRLSLERHDENPTQLPLLHLSLRFESFGYALEHCVAVGHIICFVAVLDNGGNLSVSSFLSEPQEESNDQEINLNT